MNTLIRKELRLLLPTWATAVALVATPALAGFALNSPRLLWLLAGGALLALMIALSTFGREFANHTFSNLLALPATRRRLWWTKVAVLAIAMVSLYGVWWASVAVCAAHWPKIVYLFSDAQITPTTTALFLLVVLTGGLWTTLAFRQVAAALWFVLLLPLALLMSADAILGRWVANPERHGAILIGLLLAYSVAGFFLAWRLFLRAEDAQWTGGTVQLPSLRWLGRQGNNFARRQRRPIRALVGKELQLHQPTLIVAALVLVLHVGIVSLRHLIPEVTKQPLIEIVFSTFWGLWLLMPALVGATAVAEERKLGLMESQLCLPTGRRRKWFLKFSVALLLGIVLGTVAPCLLESADHLPRFFTNPNSASPIGPYDHWLTIGIITAGIGLVAFHASSLARNTLQALGLAALSALFGTLLFNTLERPDLVFDRTLWQGNLGLIIGYPAVAVALLLLSAGNFRHPSITGRRWARNLVVLFAVSVGTTLAATGIYHRAWESFADSDPAHGPTRFNAASAPILSHDGQLSARTAQGEIVVFPQVWRARTRAWFNAAIFSEHWSQASLGSNWTSHVTSYFETVAVRNDGTLWASEASPPNMTRSDEPIEPPAALAQFGSETNWQSVARDPALGRSVLLLKTDGTLWRWRATNHVNRESILTTAVPYRLGDNSNWTSIISSGPSAYLTTTDGEAWGLNTIYRLSRSNSRGRALDAGLHLEPLQAPGPSSAEWRSLTGAGNYVLGVKTNGTLWAFGVLPWARSQAQAPLDPGADWKAVAANNSSALALKQDGSLWKLDVSSWNRPPQISRLSQQHDWLAVTSSYDAVFALAADGTIWSWGTYAYRPGGISIAPSAIPVKVALLP